MEGVLSDYEKNPLPMRKTAEHAMEKITSKRRRGGATPIPQTKSEGTATKRVAQKFAKNMRKGENPDLSKQWCAKRNVIVKRKTDDSTPVTSIAAKSMRETKNPDVSKQRCTMPTAIVKAKVDDSDKGTSPTSMNLRKRKSPHVSEQQQANEVAVDDAEKNVAESGNPDVYERQDPNRNVAVNTEIRDLLEDTLPASNNMLKRKSPHLSEQQQTSEVTMDDAEKNMPERDNPHVYEQQDPMRNEVEAKRVADGSPTLGSSSEKCSQQDNTTSLGAITVQKEPVDEGEGHSSNFMAEIKAMDSMKMGDATPGIPFIKEAVPSQEEIVYGESESEFVSDEQPRPRTQELNGVKFEYAYDLKKDIERWFYLKNQIKVAKRYRDLLEKGIDALELYGACKSRTATIESKDDKKPCSSVK